MSWHTIVELMKLNKCILHKKYRITQINMESEIAADFLSLGILCGDLVIVTHISPLGSPISIKHERGHFFALRTEQAEMIDVELRINN